MGKLGGLRRPDPEQKINIHQGDMNMEWNSNSGLTRRRLLQVTAGGVVVSGLGVPRSLAEPYDGTFTWISPRGTLEVLDDYAYWIGKKMGYFEGLDVEMQPGPSDGTATVKFVDVGQADMGFPSPGVFSFAIENGMDLKSVFHMGALDTFSLAFRKGEGPSDIKELEGKTILLGSAAWQPIVDPMLAAQGVDISTIDLSSRPAGRPGVPRWPRVRATPRSRGKGCGRNGSPPGSNSSTGWASRTRRCRPTPSWCGPPTSRIPTSKAFLEQYLRGWAMGLEFAEHNPAAAVQAVFEQFPTLASNLGPELGLMSIIQQMNVFRGDMASARGLGLARHGELAAVLRSLGSRSARIRDADRRRRRSAPTN